MDCPADLHQSAQHSHTDISMAQGQHLTRVCSRLPEAYAPASLRLPAAAHRQRSASEDFDGRVAQR
jgi:hypothetical protein